MFDEITVLRFFDLSFFDHNLCFLDQVSFYSLALFIIVIEITYIFAKFHKSHGLYFKNIKLSTVSTSLKYTQLHIIK